MNDVTSRCADLVFTEGRLIDQREWDAWIDLYQEDAEFWVPATNGEDLSYTSDPDNEISLIYYADRSGLEDRVFRIRTGLSSASVPLARTSHVIGSVQAQVIGEGDFLVNSSWITTSFKNKKTLTFAGRYEHKIREQADGSLKIAAKK
ncbi:MAG: aromatic-ring-hydroxylating dioxygenase subunit beta, partial [Gammaproteobacteria bacterium]